MRLFAQALLTSIAVLGVPVTASSQATDPSPMSPLGIERTERLLDRRVACRGCHVIAGDGGLIGPVLDGVASRTSREALTRTIRDPSSTMPGTVMPPQRMPDAEVQRLVDYLLTLPERPTPDAQPPQASPPLADSETLDGEALYARHCAACHGDMGEGDGWNAPNLPVAPTAHADAAQMSTRPDDSLYDAIFAGGYVLDRSPRMPAFGEHLTTEQIRALVAHIRELCDCTQPAWAGGES